LNWVANLNSRSPHSDFPEFPGLNRFVHHLIKLYIWLKTNYWQVAADSRKI
jgi:hypothetical protein